MLDLVGLMLLDLLGLIMDQVQDSPRGLIVSIVRNWATLNTLVGLYMASLRIGSPDNPIKPILIRPPPKPRQTKHPQKFVSQLLVWGLIPTNLQNYMSFFLISKPLVSLLPLCPLVLWPKKVPFYQHLAPCLILLPGLSTLVHLII